LNLRILALALALSPAMFPVAHARAVELLVTGPDPSYSFDLPLSPVIGVGDYSPGLSFTTDGYTFFSTSNGGGFATALNQYFGAQIYSGPESSPTFQAGVYKVFNANSRNVDTLTVAVLGLSTNNVNVGGLTAVPELSTWTMMLAGLCGLGFAGYRRNKAATLAA
jgi:hypothetical protein